MLPTYERLDAPQPLVRIPFRRLAVLVASLPLFGLIFCIVWCLLYEFERSTATHCDVPNYLPSVSAAIGNYEPQKFVWRLAIVLHFPPRMGVAFMYLGYFRETIRRNRRVFGAFACALHVVENLALVSLSLWTSSDDYEMHRNAFMIFIICSEVYMLILYFLIKNGRKVALLPMEERSLRYKRNCFITNVVCFSIAGYCFVRHNSRCEPLVYTFFALFEYIVVVTNLAYHLTAFMDFYAYNVNFDWVKGLYLSQS